MMKRSLSRMLALTLCAAVLCALPAFAAEKEPAEAPDYLAPVQAWGSVTVLENGSLLLENTSSSQQSLIVHLEETTPILDAVTGLPLDRELRQGETVYVWVGPAMTLSLPPQASAEVVVANIPADFAVPQYVQIARVEPQAMAAIEPAPPLTYVDLVTTGGQKLTITDKAVLTPHLTRQLVTLESLVPGTRMLVWTDASQTVTKVLVFAGGYRGWISWTPDGRVSVSYHTLSELGKTVNGEMLLPVRAVAEALGMEVHWDAERGAVVSYGKEMVEPAPADSNVLFSAMPGGTILRWDAEGKTDETYGTCLVENGVTYLSAATLTSLLGLFISK